MFDQFLDARHYRVNLGNNGNRVSSAKKGCWPVAEAEVSEHTENMLKISWMSWGAVDETPNQFFVFIVYIVIPWLKQYKRSFQKQQSYLIFVLNACRVQSQF